MKLEFFLFPGIGEYFYSEFKASVSKSSCVKGLGAGAIEESEIFA